MSETFFENPLYVYFTLGFGELVLAAIWHERRNRRWALSLLIPVVLAGAVVLVERLVVTDREQITAAAREIARDIENGEVAALERHLAADFAGIYEGIPLSKQMAIVACMREKGRYGIRAIRFGNVKVIVLDRLANMTVVTRITFETAELGRAMMKVTFDLKWVETPEGWQLRSAEEPRKELGL